MAGRPRARPLPLPGRPLPQPRRDRVLHRTVFAVVAALLAGVTNVRADVTLLTEENPPFSFATQDGLRGLAADAAEEAMRRAGLTPRVEMLPWDRAWVRARSEPDTCLFPVARLPERVALFAWVGPLAVNAWGLFARSGFAGTVRTMADARRYRIGVADDPAKLDFLRASGATDVSHAPDPDNASRLALPAGAPGHIDLWLAGIHGARIAAGKGRADALRLVAVVREIPLYAACNRRTTPASLKALDAAVRGMERDGTAARIAAGYDPRWPR